MIKKQVLGTAQFGLDYYGISNFSKKKSANQLMPLLYKAYINGVIASDKYVNVTKSIKYMVYSFCVLIALLLFEFLMMS